MFGAESTQPSYRRQYSTTGTQTTTNTDMGLYVCDVKMTDDDFTVCHQSPFQGAVVTQTCGQSHTISFLASEDRYNYDCKEFCETALVSP